jgi:hypothetical protein
MVVCTLSKREKIAVGVSAAIVFATVVYWLWQIKDVIATLRMAYGQ